MIQPVCILGDHMSLSAIWEVIALTVCINKKCSCTRLIVSAITSKIAREFM